MVGTIVVNVTAEEENIHHVWRPHFFIVGLIFLAGEMVPIIITTMIPQVPMLQLTESRNAILKNPSVVSAFVSVGKTTFNTVETGKTESTFFRARLGLWKNQISDAALAKKMANVLLTHYPGGIQKFSIQITLIYGYSIGIALKWMQYTHIFKSSDFSSSA